LSQVWNASKGDYDVTTKTYGKSIHAADLPDGLRRVFPAQSDDSTGPGLPKPLLRDVLRLILARFRLLRALIEPFEWRVRGGSVLVVYEGDAEALARVLPAARADPAEEEVESDEDEDEETPSRTRAFDVRLIDFAHATRRSGDGPDEGYNLGLRTTEELLAGRLAELEGAM
jgi:1D-myo-inositol-tetrakisphosphate 5-kinase/inositol-polyphosphate multikinase